MTKPSAFILWQQAQQEHPNDSGAAGARYRELLIEHGLARKAEPGEDTNLPCGWPGQPSHDGACCDG